MSINDNIDMKYTRDIIADPNKMYDNIASINNDAKIPRLT
ncbi:hypothetical protein HS5_21070 [Acidianus sp. HS-5]|nr:hypothetical protein HS5_21070 [Acidianus sp. HS-5]